MTLYIVNMTAFTRLIPCLVFLLFSMATAALPEGQPLQSAPPVQDQANILSPTVKNDLASLIASDSRAIRLLIVADRKQDGAAGSFTEYVDALAQSLGINERPLAILLVHDIKSENIALRLGHGFTDQYRRSARTLINRIYQQYLQYQLYNAGYSTGIAALVKHLPKIEYPTRSKPSGTVLLEDNGALIQDHVGLIVPNETGAFAVKLLAQSRTGQMVRLVIIQRHQDLNNDKFLAAFANKLFDQWGMDDLHNAVLVLYEAQSNTVMLRLGYGFSPNESRQAFEVLNTEYKHLLRQQKFNQAHQSGMLAIMKVLGKPSGPVSAPAAAVTSPHADGADLPVSPQDTGEMVQDSAGILAPVAVINLNRLANGFKAAKIRILTVKNYLEHSNSKDFQSYANKLFSSRQFSSTAGAIFIVHDVKSKQITVAFAPTHAMAEQNRLRRLIIEAYAPGLRLGLLNAAHIMGVKALIGGFDAPVSQAVAPENDNREQTATAPTARPPVLLGAVSVIAAILTVFAIVAFLSYRKSTGGRRIRRARISAWKQANRGQK